MTPGYLDGPHHEKRPDPTPRQMHYQIVYMKRGFPLTTWASSAERAHQLAEQLRRVGYSVDVWQHTERGSRKTDL